MFVAVGRPVARLNSARPQAVRQQAQGSSETVIGKWLKTQTDRHDLTIATKGAHPAWESIETPRLSQSEVTQDCERSLQALGLDTITLYWLHRDDSSREIAEIFETLESLRRAGKICYYGCSNWSSPRMREARNYADTHGLPGFVANQPMWSFARVNPEGLPDSTSLSMDDAMQGFHAETGIPVIPYTSQAKGLFSKWARDGIENLDPNLRTSYDNSVNRTRFQKLTELARQTGHNVTTLALAWLTSQPDFITISIVWGKAEQLTDVLNAGDLVLDADTLAYLTS
jgi:aryl-alcohol dehydrogenase-like predicted oxidoreductase